MRTLRPALVACLAALVLAGCGATSDAKDAAATTATGAATPEPSSRTVTESACDVLTPAVAKALLGSVGADTSPTPDTSTADLRVSTCVRTSSVADGGTAQSASLLMRVAASATGRQGNESVFGDGALPRGAQTVSGYGDKAFWNPAFGQLNVLSHGNWYVLSAGPIDPRKHTLAQTEKLADALAQHL